MSKIAILGDIHFGINNDNENILDYQLEVLKETLDNIKAEGIRTVIQLGDIFDRRKYINFKTHDRVIDFFKQYENINFYILAGNHDVYFKNTNIISSLTLFEQFSNITLIIHTPKIIEIGNTSICLLPWLSSEEMIESCMEFIETNDIDLLCGHLELEGFLLTKGIMSSEGQIPLDIIKQIPNVVSGHYHAQSKQNNITYLGSLFQLTWADYNLPKGYIIFDTLEKTYNIINHDEKFIRYKVANIHSLNDIENFLTIIDQNNFTKFKLFVEVEDNTIDLRLIDIKQKYGDRVKIVRNTMAYDVESINTDIENIDVQDIWNMYIDSLTTLSEREKQLLKQRFTYTYLHILNNESTNDI